MGEVLEKNLKSTSSWLRVLYMIGFMLVLGVLDLVLAVVVLFQVIMSLFTGKANPRVADFGRKLGLYICQIYHFLTYHSETMPFPARDWPNGEESPNAAEVKKTESKTVTTVKKSPPKKSPAKKSPAKKAATPKPEKKSEKAPEKKDHK